MRTKNELKILLCYIVKSLDMPVPKKVIEELFQITELANYFEVGDSVFALVDAGMFSETVNEDGEDCLVLTPDGKRASDELDTDVPMSTRKKAVEAAQKLIAQRNIRRFTETKIEKLEKGYNVTLTVKDKDVIMMQTVLYAADGIQANALCDSFSDNPTKLYSGIVDILTSAHGEKNG